MFKAVFTVLAACLCTVALGLCCSAAPQPDLNKGQRQPTTPLPAEVAIPETAQEAVDWALADLASRLELGENDVQVVAVRSAEWRDSSLGCASPGQMHAQVITPGHIVLLSAAGQTWEYHAARNAATAIFCNAPAPAAPRPVPYSAI